MVDQTDNMVVYGDSAITDIFGQLYHTPVSTLWFRLRTINDADYVNLAPWFQCVYSVHYTANMDASGAIDGFSVQISGTYPNNCGPIVIFHDPAVNVSGLVYDFEVIGHKAMHGTAFAGHV